MSGQVAVRRKYKPGRVYKEKGIKFRICSLCGETRILHTDKNASTICSKCKKYQVRLERIQKKNRQAEAERRRNQEKPITEPIPETCPVCGGKPAYDPRRDEVYCPSCWATLTGPYADWDTAEPVK